TVGSRATISDTPVDRALGVKSTSPMYWALIVWATGVIFPGVPPELKTVMAPGSNIRSTWPAFKTATPLAPTLTDPRVIVVLPPNRNLPELVELVRMVSVKTTVPSVGGPAVKRGNARTVAVAAQFWP